MKRHLVKIAALMFWGMFSVLNAGMVENPYCKEVELTLARISELREVRSRLQYELSDLFKSTPLADVAANIARTEGSEAGGFITSGEQETVEILRALGKVNNALIKFGNNPNSGNLISLQNELRVQMSSLQRWVPEEEYYLWNQKAAPVRETRQAIETSIANANIILEAKSAAQTLAEITGSGACFIATAAYGTPMAEEVDDLRWYRDNYMLANLVGRFLVDIYYTVSPPIADLIAQNEDARTVTRFLLSPIVTPVHQLRKREEQNQ